MADKLDRLLAISWAMPPLSYPRSIQVSRTLVGLTELGWYVTVITRDSKSTLLGEVSDPSLQKLYRNKYTIIPVPHDDSPLDPLTTPWLNPAVASASKELERGQYSILVSFAQPWVDHLVGLELKRKFNIPWIAHFSDPWVDSIYYKDIPLNTINAWKSMEKEIIYLADRVIFTNHQAEELVMKKYPPAWRKKTISIPHCYDRSFLLSSISDKDHSRLRLIFTGDLYGPRRPDSLFSALLQLNNEMEIEGKLDIRLIGQSQPEHRQMAKQGLLARIIHFEERIPYTDSLKAIAASDALLLIDAQTIEGSPFLPSKLVDYFMFQKPILGLTPLQGTSANILRQAGCKVVAPDDVQGIIHVLKEMLIDWQSGSLRVGPEFSQVARQFDPLQTSKSMDQVLRSTMNHLYKQQEL